jgi:hypothetical protein
MSHGWDRREMQVGLFVGKQEGKIPLGRHRHRWEFRVKIYVTNVMGWCGLD